MKVQKNYAFGRPDITEAEVRAVSRVLRSGWIAFGKESIALEKEVVEFTGARDGVVVSSGTAALHLALILRGVKSGDEIITTPLTFAATANTIIHLGAKPVLVDIDPVTLNIDENKIESAITKKTKGIVVVHFGGLPCNMKRINAIAKKHKLFVNEDAAHALGAMVDGKMIGEGNNIVCFSFYANKNLTTVEGGLLTAPKPALAERARSLRFHGLSSQSWKRFHSSSKLLFGVIEPGYKYNIDDVRATIGRQQFRRFVGNQKRRTAYAKIYDRVLGTLSGIQVQPKYFEDKKIIHALHLYTVVIDQKKFSCSRDELVFALREAGVFAVVHYLPLHQHPYYKKLYKFSDKDFPNASNVGKHIISLPLLPQISSQETRALANRIRGVFVKYHK